MFLSFSVATVQCEFVWTGQVLRLATSLISQFFNTFAFFAQVVELGEAVDRLEKEEELGCAE